MKYRPHAAQGNPHARSFACTKLGPIRLEHRLDVGPGEIRTRGRGEDRRERFLVFAHLLIVPFYDTTSKAAAFWVDAAKKANCA